MKTTHTIVAMMTAAFAAATALAGDSAPFRLDTIPSPRIASAGGADRLLAALERGGLMLDCSR